MSIPLLNYKPSSQNQRVSGYEVPSEDTPRIYRTEDCLDQNDVLELIWAVYRQVLSEHEILKSNRQTSLESQLKIVRLLCVILFEVWQNLMHFIA
jgi:phycobilisome rod-core linker protein